MSLSNDFIMSTRAAVLCQQKKPLQLMKLFIPPLQKGQVLVRINYSGLCHTQLGEIDGIKGPDAYLPHTLGHEGFGEVVRVGEDVLSLKEGDKVLLSWLPGLEGTSTPIFYWDEEGKKVNSGPISTLLEYAVIAQNKLLKVSPQLPEKYYPILGCSFSTAFGVLNKDLAVKNPTDSSVVIWGVGGVGLCLISAAKHLGLNRIVAVDIEADKLQLAKGLGASDTYHALEDQELLERDLRALKGEVYGVDCTGNIQVMEKAFSLIKNTFCIVGNPAVGEKLRLDPYDFIRGKRLIGSWGGGVHLGKDFAAIFSAFEEQFEKLKSIFTHEVSLEEVNEGFQILRSRKAGRVLVRHR